MKLTTEQRDMEEGDRIERRLKDPWRADISQRMQTMEGQHTSLRIAVDANTEITTVIKKNTDEIVEFFEAGKGFFKVARWIGLIAKWVTVMLAAGGAVLAAIHWGNPK